MFDPYRILRILQRSEQPNPMPQRFKLVRNAEGELDVVPISNVNDTLHEGIYPRYIHGRRSWIKPVSATQNSAKLEKLRQMTVANGCTLAEEQTAKRLLSEMEARTLRIDFD